MARDENDIHQIGDLKYLLSTLEQLAKAVTDKWAQIREGDCATDEAVLSALETPIEALERWFEEPDEPRQPR